jgi:hypothetical protein
MVGAIDAEKRKVIINSGAFGYNAEILASLLEEDTKDVVEKLKPNGEYYKMYQKGKNLARYKIDEKLFDMACSGDLNAIKQFQNSREDG